MINQACKRCRERKLKCDGSSPCGTCTLRGEGTNCDRVSRKERLRKDGGLVNLTEDSQDPLPTFGPESHDNLKLNVEAGHHPTSFEVTPPMEPKWLDQQGAANSSHYAEDWLITLALENLASTSLADSIVHESYFWRAAASAHSCIHLPTVSKTIADIFATANGFNKVEISIDDLALCFMTVAIGMQFLPKDELATDLVQRIKESSSASATPPSRQRLLSFTALQCIRRQTEATLAQVQTIILLLLYDQDDDETKHALFITAVQSALRLGMNKITSFDNLDVTQEMMVRCWWFLVCRSWLGSISSPGDDIIPSQDIKVRGPLAMSDLQLLHPLKQASHTSPSGFTNFDRQDESYHPVRYSITLIQLACLVKRNVDIRKTKVYSRAQLCKLADQEFSIFCEGLPKSYSLIGSELHQTNKTPVESLEFFYGQCKTSVERWFLHQFLFHAFLELYYFESHVPIPDIFISLSGHMLDTQAEVSGLCWVHDTLRVRVTNVVKACILLVFDSLYKIESNIQDGISRALVLQKVTMSIRICQEAKESQETDFTFLFYLMKLEESKWNQYSKLGQGSRQHMGLDHPMMNRSIIDNSQDRSIQLAPSRSAPESTPYEGREVDQEWSSMIPSDGAFNPLLNSSEVHQNWQVVYDSLYAAYSR